MKRLFDPRAFGDLPIQVDWLALLLAVVVACGIVYLALFALQS